MKLAIKINTLYIGKKGQKVLNIKIVYMKSHLSDIII